DSEFATLHRTIQWASRLMWVKAFRRHARCSQPPDLRTTAIFCGDGVQGILIVVGRNGAVVRSCSREIGQVIFFVIGQNVEADLHVIAIGKVAGRELWLLS